MTDELYQIIAFAWGAIGLPYGLYYLYDQQKRANKKAFLEEKGVLHQELSQQLSDAKRRNDELTQKTDQYEDQLREVNEYFQSIKPDLDKVDYIRDAIQDMEDVWLNDARSESDCEEVFLKYKWVLEPDYKIEDLHVRKSIKNAIGILLGNEAFSEPAYKNMPYNANLVVDLFALANVKSSLQPNLINQGKQVPLLLEIKAPNVVIGAKEIEQIYAYALGLLNLSSRKLWGEPIECLVIGKKLSSDIHDIYLRFGAETHGAVRITPMTYAQLIHRARTMYRHFLETVPDNPAHQLASDDPQPVDAPKPVPAPTPPKRQDADQKPLQQPPPQRITTPVTATPTSPKDPAATPPVFTQKERTARENPAFPTAEEDAESIFDLR